ncbi:MAG: gamma-glutamyltransferase family protein [Rubrivivax sp.]
MDLRLRALSLALSGALLVCTATAPGHARAQSAAATAAPAGLPVMPEDGTVSTVGRAQDRGVVARRHMVATANPLATETGLRILQAGGSAVDAMVAVQMVLTLVEPQSSGIGGGAFLLHWDGAKVTALDGRETAPAEATEALFLLPDGKPMAFRQAVVGGRSVGVPGTVRLMEAAHRRHGRLPWASLFQPAIALAQQGFAISPRLHASLKDETALRQVPQAAAFYYAPDGQPHPVGHVLKNPALAAVLRAIADGGSAAFYRGAVAQDLVQRVRGHPTNPGTLALADLAAYDVVEREAICSPWRTWRVCGFPPPSSGHLAIMQILGIGEHLGWGAAPLDAQGLPGEDFLHRYTEAARLAYADRALYVADPAFVQAPGGAWTQMLDPGYLRDRAAMVGPRSMGTAEAGVPPGAQRTAYAPQALQPEAGTSHVSIVDSQGQALALTTTIESGWGARILADGGTGLPGGYLLNNELTDFSFAPADAQGRPIANRVQPGKRPRSSMSPTLVFDAAPGALHMSLGSPGGAAIIHYAAKTLLGTLAFGLDAQRAIDLPNFGSYNGPTVLEKGRFGLPTVQALQARGHTVREVELTSGLQAIQRTAEGWSGGADPRREGRVMGE